MLVNVFIVNESGKKCKKFIKNEHHPQEIGRFQKVAVPDIHTITRQASEKILILQSPVQNFGYLRFRAPHSIKHCHKCLKTKWFLSLFGIFRTDIGPLS